MAHLRFEALKKLSERTRVHVDLPSPNVSKFFGENVFGMEQMRGTLGPAVYKKVSASIKNHEKIDEATADAVAAAAKSWAMAKGASFHRLRPGYFQLCSNVVGGDVNFARPRVPPPHFVRCEKRHVRFCLQRRDRRFNVLNYFFLC